MESIKEPQQFSFQAEIKQLLDLLAHSLYQSKEIAIRELISNASDALDKMRYVSLTNEAKRSETPLEIVIEGRPDAQELVIRDNGVGMSREELVKNLGTIAHSGSREFLKSATAFTDAKDQTKAISLNGQFGVGFYSAFMVADKVRVRSRSVDSDEGWEWESDGTGTFLVRECEGLSRGTEIVLHLKDATKDFADDWRIKSIIRRYSSFVPHPIKVGGEVVNSQKPIWVEPKRSVTDEQYLEFYRHLTHGSDEKPLWHLHLSADSPIQFHAILYCPDSNPELLGYGRNEHGLSLCAKRVLVQSDCRELLPEYLRFLHGIVDSEDLPLNVSRETLQDNTLIRRIRTTLVKGVFDKLDKLAEESPQEYLKFYRQFGVILKEGIARDPMNRDRVAKLMRLLSTTHDDPDNPTSLDEYIKRCGEDQKSIYYLGGPDLASIKKSPNLEIFRKRGIEVLLLNEAVDEFVMSALGRYSERSLVSIDAADVELPEPKSTDESETKTEEPAPPTAELGKVIELFKESLGGRVVDVRPSKRLTDSPCCLVNSESGMSSQMQKLLRASSRDVPETPRILEVNPESPLIKRLAALSANHDHDAFIKLCAMQLWSNALLLEGTVLEPESMVNRNYAFMDEAAEKRSPIIL